MVAINVFKIDELLEKINEYRKGRCICRRSNERRKSTLINKLIQSIGETGEVITTSQYPGTTLGQIDIPFDEHSSLVDTPGIIHRHQITLLSGKEMKKVYRKKSYNQRHSN